MAQQNTNPARGMRDFLPADVRRREYVIGIIKDVYQKYGFEPLETPAVENLETLMGKYGEEGNQLIFKILKRGEGERTGEADLALRYDLTVPLARVIANYKNELPKFFKRYQIQPVWRADRPARGRFREFYQCDVDAVGSKSMVIEAELISAVSDVLNRLRFDNFVIKINHRKVLSAVLDEAGVERDRHIEALIALDKLDKIGTDGVKKEFKDRGLSETAFESISGLFSRIEERSRNVFHIKESSHVKQPDLILWNDLAIKEVRRMIGEHEEGKIALEELSLLFDLLNKVNHWKFQFLPNLARGLSYYTGAIFEISIGRDKSDEPDFTSSIGGGGRYNGLIGMFGKEEIPACGFSLGLERILVVMDERGMFPEHLTRAAADILVTILTEKNVADSLNEKNIADSLELANELRAQGLRVVVYPEADKLGKQFKYASSIGVSAVAILGDDERASNSVTIKYLETGDQETISRERLSTELKI